MNKNLVYETVGELFCGPGGGALGASMSSYTDKNKEVRIRHSWATDYDKDTCETYLENISKYETESHGRKDAVNVIQGDINSGAIDLNLASQFPAVDGLIFGFPCNDFSLVGETKGLGGTFGPLYKHGIKILNRSDKPKWFIAENVSGLSSANNGLALKKIESEMREAGYTINTHKYKFEEYGLPQARHRIIIVGFRNDLAISYEIPGTTKKRLSARDALRDIPNSAPNQEFTRQSAQVVERLGYIKPGDNAWSSDIPERLRLNVLNTKLSNIYKRLDPNKPAYTVTGSGGGGTHMYHWEEPRALTNRERARLQTFPDWFKFCGTKESVRKQIGMAIPPMGIKFICDSILKALYK